MYQEARLARQWMKGTRNNEHTRQVFGGFTSGSFDSAEDERTTRLDLDSAEDERTRNSEHSVKSLVILLVARLTQQRMKERGIMIIRVKSLVVLLVARLTRQGMKKRGMMDVRV